MNRRDFLTRSGAFLVGAFWGLGSLSRGFAFEGERDPACGRPRVALIIDDIGYSAFRARQFLALGIPITFAVLPRLPHSQDLACEIHSEGHEVMLHQPMEPFDRSLHPGPGALYVGDEGKKIERILTENLGEIPFVCGVNNHMGSRFTSYERETHDALGVIGERGLFFVDSLTSSRSVACETARRLRVPTAYRHIFLDHYPGEEAIFHSLEMLRICALKRGSGIGIGHPFPETARAIHRFTRVLRGSDISLVHISSMIPPCA